MAKLAREGKGALKCQVTVEETKSGSTAIIGPVRLSYMAAFKPRKNPKRGDQLEYSVVGLIGDDDEEMLDFIDERIEHALVKKLGKKIARFESCLRDGNEDIDEAGDPVYPGFMYISTRAEIDQPPLLYGPDRKLLDGTDAANWVSGDWGYLKLDWFGYNNENKGVSTRVKAIQFCAKDEAFGKGAEDPDKVADEFGDVEGVDAPDEDDDDKPARSSRSSRASKDEDEKPRRRRMLD